METPRIRAVLNLVEVGMTPVEIGADRAPFAIAFFRRFQRSCFASEVAEGPFRALEKSIESSGLSDQITIYKADGLASFPAGADTALLCGMGGLTIAKILAKAQDIPQLKTIIIEPQSHFAEARHALLKAGFTIDADSYVDEANRFYPVIRGRRGPLDAPYSPLEEKFGRLALQAADPLLKAHLERIVAVLSHDLKESNNQTSLQRLESAKTALKTYFKTPKAN